MDQAAYTRIEKLLADLRRRRAFLRSLHAARFTLAAFGLWAAAAGMAFFLTGGLAEAAPWLWAALAAAAVASGAVSVAVGAHALGQPRALGAMDADRHWQLKDRLVTTAAFWHCASPPAMAGLLLDDTARHLPANPTGSQVYPLARACVFLLPGLAALGATALLLLATTHTVTEPHAPAIRKKPDASALPKTLPKKDTPRKTPQKPPASKEKATAKKPSEGTPLNQKDLKRRGRFEKVYVKPLFEGPAHTASSAAQPKETKGPGFGPGRARLPDRSVQSFAKQAETALRRGLYSQADRDLVSSYFTSLGLHFHEEKKGIPDKSDAGEDK